MEQNYKKLLAGRVDLIYGFPEVVSFKFGRLRLDFEKIEAVYLLEEGSIGYLATGKNTSDKVVSRLKDALDRLEKKGTITLLKQKYRLSE